jgi:hypothetical protein
LDTSKSHSLHLRTYLGILISRKTIIVSEFIGYTFRRERKKLRIRQGSQGTWARFMLLPIDGETIMQGGFAISKTQFSPFESGNQLAVNLDLHSALGALRKLTAASDE